MDETAQTSTPEKKGGMNMVLIVVAIAVVLIGGFMLFNRPTNEATTDTAPVETMEQPATGETTTSAPAASDVVTIEMEAGSFFYTPTEIRVKKGQTVRINMKAVDMMHDLNIDELGVDGPVIREGETTTMEFVASEVGSFEYYCSVGQHRANGQVGTLIVEE